jgi:plastocyanin
MTPLDPLRRSSLMSRRTLLALSGGTLALFAIPSAIALSRGDDDDHDDDHDDDDRDHDDDDHDDDRDHNDDDGKVAPIGTVPPGSAEVRIVDDDADGFKPGEITIGLVTFVNLDDDPHTATGAKFDTGRINPGEQVTVTFEEPGVYVYACEYHPIMTGAVNVRNEQGDVPGASASASPAASPVDGASAEVTILNFAFDPAELEIEAGTTVTWTNDDSVPHTATADDGAFDTGILRTGESASHRFDTRGTFPYICALHPSMTGTITVT